MGENMKTFIRAVFQFFIININIDMRLKMFFMRRFTMEHQLVIVEKYIVSIVQIIIRLLIVKNTDFNLRIRF